MVNKPDSRLVYEKAYLDQRGSFDGLKLIGES